MFFYFVFLQVYFAHLGVAAMPTLVLFQLLFYLHAITLIVLLPLPHSCILVIFPSSYRADGAEIQDTAATTFLFFKEKPCLMCRLFLSQYLLQIHQIVLFYDIPNFKFTRENTVLSC